MDQINYFHNVQKHRPIEILWHVDHLVEIDNYYINQQL